MKCFQNIFKANIAKQKSILIYCISVAARKTEFQNLLKNNEVKEIVVDKTEDCKTIVEIFKTNLLVGNLQLVTP